MGHAAPKKTIMNGAPPKLRKPPREPFLIRFLDWITGYEPPKVSAMYMLTGDPDTPYDPPMGYQPKQGPGPSPPTTVFHPPEGRNWVEEVKALYMRSDDMYYWEFEELMDVAIRGKRPDDPRLPDTKPRVPIGPGASVNRAMISGNEDAHFVAEHFNTPHTGLPPAFETESYLRMQAYTSLPLRTIHE